MMRPAVCSGYSSRFSTSPDSFRPINSSTAVDSSSGQVVDQGCSVVGRQLLNEFGDLVRRTPREQTGAGFGAELAEGLHREPAVALDEHREGRQAIALEQLAENLREVRGMLLLEEIRQVRRRADPEEALAESRTRSTLRCGGIRTLYCNMPTGSEKGAKQ